MTAIQVYFTSFNMTDVCEKHTVDYQYQYPAQSLFYAFVCDRNLQSEEQVQPHTNYGGLVCGRRV